MGIMRLGFVHIRTNDLEASARHYRDTLGMQLSATVDGRQYFKGWDEFDHHSVVVEDGGVGLVKLGMKCASLDDLEGYERRLGAFGVTTSRISKGQHHAMGEALSVQLPTGQTMELYADMEYVGTEVGTFNPQSIIRDPRGAMVPRLDHMLIAGEDPLHTERMFMGCLDFKCSERLIADVESNDLIATWLFTSGSSHDIALIKGEQGKLHHFAFWMNSWDEILRAGDIFALDDVSVDYGPTRHGITRGLTTYFFDPAGNRNETFAGGYTSYRDRPTIIWTADQLAKGIFYHARELKESFTAVYT